jgi:hypothetical protein
MRFGFFGNWLMSRSPAAGSTRRLILLTCYDRVRPCSATHSANRDKAGNEVAPGRNRGWGSAGCSRGTGESAAQTAALRVQSSPARRRPLFQSAPQGRIRGSLWRRREHRGRGKRRRIPRCAARSHAADRTARGQALPYSIALRHSQRDRVPRCQREPRPPIIYRNPLALVAHLALIARKPIDFRTFSRRC